MDTARPNREWGVIALIGTGHFLSHFYMLCLAPLFPAWRDEFGVSYATLGLSIALMSGVTALLQTPVGFLVDRYGARRFLVGGTLIMALSISGMAFMPTFWGILALAVLSGIGNSVFHPADYAILAGSIDKSRMGRAFAMHTFTGNLGFGLAPPVIAILAVTIGWRNALLFVGLLGLPVAVAVLWLSRILSDQPERRPEGKPVGGRELLFSRAILLFFAFFLLSAMAGAGMQSFVITVMNELWAMPIAIGSMVLTGYMVGATGGTLVGGWFADRSDKHLLFIVVLTLLSATLILSLGLIHWPQPLAIAVSFVGGLFLGASRTPRDVMLKNAAPPGQIGKVFGFVSAGLPLGSAIMPVPVGMLLDAGLAHLVLPLIAAILVLSLVCAGLGEGRQMLRRKPVAVPAE